MRAGPKSGDQNNQRCSRNAMLVGSWVLGFAGSPEPIARSVLKIIIKKRQLSTSTLNTATANSDQVVRGMVLIDCTALNLQLIALAKER